MSLHVCEGDDTWEFLVLLKDIVELAVAPRRTERTLHFLFGPLCEVWTMLFEGKFFKRTISTALNFKNVAVTLATKHQQAISYRLDCSSFFRPSVEMSQVKPVLLCTFPPNVHTAIDHSIRTPGSVLNV